jgi:8-amino-7-oxononanoate synthase
LRAVLADQGWALPDPDVPTPIVPLVVGEAEQALALSGRLAEQGLLAPAIRPPAVAAGTARVRLTLRSDLADSDIDRIADAAGGPEASPSV